MKGEEIEVKKAVKEIGEKLNGKGFPELAADAVQKILVKGMLPKEALGFSDEKIENLYAQAYRLFNAGKFADALELFRMLTFLDTTDSRYSMGLAACLHMLKEYYGAMKVYTVCNVLDTLDPLPSFHASDCYIQLGDKAAAVLMLAIAIERAGNRPEFQIMKDRAIMTMENLKRELGLSAGDQSKAK